MSDTIEPAKEVEKPFTFPNEPLVPTKPLVFDDRELVRKPIWKPVAAVVAALLIMELGAWAWWNSKLPSVPVPSISWPAPKPVEKPAPAPEKQVDAKAELIELAAEWIRVNRQVAFEEAKAAPVKAEIDKLKARLDEIKVEVSALIPKLPKGEPIPPELRRFTDGITK